VIFVVVVVLAVAFDLAAAFAFTQYLMISLMISSAQLNWQTIMTQMREQSRQITILFNAVSQLVSSIAKFKRKLIVIFSSSEDLIFTNIQRASNKRVVKFTKRAQTIRIETARVKRAKIHERSIESLISLNFETTHIEQSSALFVNKHVSSQSNRVNLFINVLSSEDLSISNQSFFESHIIAKFEIIYDSMNAFLFVFVSIFEIESHTAHQWLSQNVSLTNNHTASTVVIILNILDTFLSLSFIDIVSSFFDENLLSQFTIILQNFFERARREVRQQVKNVYSYDLVINQIVRSFFNDAFSTTAFSHLLLYLSSTVNIQISTSAIREVRQRRDIDRFRDRLRESDVERDTSRTWILSLSQTILERQASAENCSFCNTMCTNSRT
jgi:hypothetical protein